MQVIIVEFGGIAFSTTGLNIKQWGWCVLFGALSLVWGQIITTIPKSVIPHLKMPCGKKKQKKDAKENDAKAKEEEEDKEEEEEKELSKISTQILRLRSLNGVERKVKNFGKKS